MRMGLDLSISHVRIDRAVEIRDKTSEEMAAIGRRKKRTASTKAGSQKVSPIPGYSQGMRMSGEPEERG